MWPLLLQLLAQKSFRFSVLSRPLAPSDGPIALILVPTRELAEQIATVLRSFLAPFGFTHLCLTGGQSEWHQKKALHAQAFHVLVATPGRFVDLVNQKYVSLARATYVVLDEADRMVSLGFERQIRSLLAAVRPDVQLVLFSATFPPRIVRLALDLLEAPVRVAVGRTGAASKGVRQETVVLKAATARGLKRSPSHRRWSGCRNTSRRRRCEERSWCSWRRVRRRRS